MRASFLKAHPRVRQGQTAEHKRHDQTDRGRLRVTGASQLETPTVQKWTVTHWHKMALFGLLANRLVPRNWLQSNTNVGTSWPTSEDIFVCCCRDGNATTPASYRYTNLPFGCESW